MSDEIVSPLDGYQIYDPVDPFENRAGPFFWATRADGSPHFVCRAQNRHCNSHGIIHGGLLMTMIDLAMVGVAQHSDNTPHREQMVTVSMTSEFISAGKVGELLEAEGQLTQRTLSLAFVRGRVCVGTRTLLTASAVLKVIRARPV